MHSWAKGHTTEPAKGSAADTEQQTAAHGVSVAYLLGRSITISTWQPPPKKASGRKSFTPLRAEPCSGVPSPASAVCTVENAAPVYTLLAMACGVFYQEFTKWHLPGKPPSPQPTSSMRSMRLFHTLRTFCVNGLNHLSIISSPPDLIPDIHLFCKDIGFLPFFLTTCIYDHMMIIFRTAAAPLQERAGSSCEKILPHTLKKDFYFIAV